MPRTETSNLPERRSPLHRCLVRGRAGADRPGGPGVTIRLRHPISIVTIIARKGKIKAASDAMKKAFGIDLPGEGRSVSARGITAHWAGYGQWYAVAEGLAEGTLNGRLEQTLAGLASLSEQGHGRVVIALEGPDVRHVLAKGTPVDLHPRVFGSGRCAVTQMAHVGVHLAQTGPEAFEVSLFRGFAQSFWEWLTEMSLEFGYEVI